MNKKNTKRSLLLSVLSLLVCCSMLVGSTFAWFTDSVASRNNVITSGNLDVELEYYNTVNEKWETVTEDLALFDESALWEPGHTRVVALKVKNVGSLALKYALAINVYSEEPGTNVYGEEFKLSDYLKVGQSAVHQDNEIGDILMNMMVSNRNAALQYSEIGFNSEIAIPTPVINAGEGHVVALTITMPTTVGNEANHKTGTDAPKISFGIELVATQAPIESDSFDSQYDANATFPEFEKPEISVTSLEQLNQILANPETGSVLNGNGLVVDIADQQYNIPSADLTIKNITFNTSSRGGTYLIANTSSEDLVFENCTFVRKETGANIIGIDATGGNIVFNNCTFEGPVMPNSVDKADGVIEFNNCNFKITTQAMIHSGYVNCMGGTHNFKNCTFDFTGGSTMGSNQYVRWNAVNSYSESYSTVVNVEGSTFINCGTQRYGSNSTLTVK